MFMYEADPIVISTIPQSPVSSSVVYCSYHFPIKYSTYNSSIIVYSGHPSFCATNPTHRTMADTIINNTKLQKHLMQEKLLWSFGWAWVWILSCSLEDLRKDWPGVPLFLFFFIQYNNNYYVFLGF